MRRFPHFYVIAHCHPSLIPSFVQIGSGFGRVIAEKKHLADPVKVNAVYVVLRVLNNLDNYLSILKAISDAQYL